MNHCVYGFGARTFGPPRNDGHPREACPVASRELQAAPRPATARRPAGSRRTSNFGSSPMAKKITGYVKLQVPAGAANPSPPIGPALGQRGLNIMEFCKASNAKT